jgi:hypothetical protein
MSKPVNKLSDAELASQARTAALVSSETADILNELADRLSPDETKQHGIPTRASGDDDADDAMKRGLD